jgi:hypothetical protein
MLHMPALKPDTIDGVARCARYGFGPNKLHLCGPDANREVLSYIQAGASDPGLERLLTGFKTLYPYLKQIASANRIPDPFDDRVVEAYWIGNELLETISPKIFFRHLAETLGLKKRYDPKSFEQLVKKLPKGARMHHSFHVLNAYQRTGHDAVWHNLESMDACRVSWGEVVRVDGPKVILKRRPLALNGHQLELGEAVEYTASRQLDAAPEFDELTPGQIVTLHWHKLCEVISDRQARWLLYYTLKHAALSNQTL